MSPDRSFVEKMLTNLKGVRLKFSSIPKWQSVHLETIEVAGIFHTKIRICFHLSEVRPDFDPAEISKVVKTTDLFIVDNKFYPGPRYYFTFSSKYSIDTNITRLHSILCGHIESSF